MKKFILNNSLNLIHIILCGYFNCHAYEWCPFLQLGLKNIWKEKHRKPEGITWCDAINIPRSRIHYILISVSTI